MPADSGDLNISPLQPYIGRILKSDWLNKLPALTFAEIKSRVAAHLKTAVDADDFDIKSAKLEELQGLWKIDVEFKKPKAMFSETALLIVDARTGEVKEFRRGY
jgi:uncharacterized membrane protein YkoI